MKIIFFVFPACIFFPFTSKFKFKLLISWISSLVTKDEISDINNLNLNLEVNGKKMQAGNTKNMIFNTNFLISYLSKFMSLQPGDLITTGTPAGVGMGMKPQVFLKSGDNIKLSIDFLGEQNSKVVVK